MNFAFYKLEASEIKLILDWYSSHNHEGYDTPEDKALVNRLKTFIGENVEEEQ